MGAAAWYRRCMILLLHEIAAFVAAIALRVLHDIAAAAIALSEGAA